MRKNTICLWYDKDAEAAARFYAATFPDSAVGAVHRAPSDYPSRQEGRRADGGIHGRSAYPVSASTAVPCSSITKPSRSRSRPKIRKRRTATGTQSSAMAGRRAQCGWCKDKWGISWQITPRVLTDALAAGGDEAKRAFDAMMGMKKIDVAAIEAARRLEGPDSCRPHLAGPLGARNDNLLSFLASLVCSQQLRLPLQSGEPRVRDRTVLPAGFPGPTRSCAWDRRNRRRTHELRRSGGESDW